MIRRNREKVALMISIESLWIDCFIMFIAGE